MVQFILAISAGTGSAVVLGVVYWRLLVLLKPVLDRLRLEVHGDALVQVGLPAVPHAQEEATSILPALESPGSSTIRMPGSAPNYLEPDAVYESDPPYLLHLNCKLGTNYRVGPGYRLDLMRNCMLNPAAHLKLELAQELGVLPISLQQHSHVVCERPGHSFVGFGQFVYLNAGVTLAPSELLIDPAERHLLLTFSKQKTAEFQEPDEGPKPLTGIAQVQEMPSLDVRLPQGYKSASRVPSLAF